MKIQIDLCCTFSVGHILVTNVSSTGQIEKEVADIEEKEKDQGSSVLTQDMDDDSKVCCWIHLSLYWVLTV